MSDGDPTKVAIACQGGGSHTAFVSGVLRGLLSEWDDEYELVGISGTSGGAFNAVVTWYGLVTGDEALAAGLLEDLWDELAAEGVTDRVTNDLVVNLSRIASTGLPVPEVSPYYTPGSRLGKDRIREVLAELVDFETLPDLCATETPELVVGTVNINAGMFETFTNEDVTTEALLASAAVPHLFEAVEINGHHHWDGLFSQNPPIDDLMTVEAERKPEELWVIQVNPQEREGEPTSIEQITDRRNELSGNISLNQELNVIERVNEWIEDGHLPESEFNNTDIHRLTLDRDLHCSTKVDRSPQFIQDLVDLGQERAAEFLAEKE